MRVIVDTNILFSALLNVTTSMAEVLLSPQDEYDFFAPEFLRVELTKHSDKLKQLSKLSSEQLAEASIRLQSRIQFISEELISQSSWRLAFEITKEVDENDTPFVALALELSAKLWTGDKKLAQGIAGKGIDIVITTSELVSALKN